MIYYRYTVINKIPVMVTGGRPVMAMWWHIDSPALPVARAGPATVTNDTLPGINRLSTAIETLPHEAGQRKGLA